MAFFARLCLSAVVGDLLSVLVTWYILGYCRHALEMTRHASEKLGHLTQKDCSQRGQEAPRIEISTEYQSYSNLQGALSY